MVSPRRQASRRKKQRSKSPEREKSFTPKRQRVAPFAFPDVLDVSADPSFSRGNNTKQFAAGDSLTSIEATYWSHKWAAKYAAQHHAPGNVVRLLGVITRELKLPPDTDVLETTTFIAAQAPAAPKSDPKKARWLTVKQAETLIRIDQSQLTESQVKEKGACLREEWKQALQKNSAVGWNVHGEYQRSHVSLVKMLQLLEQGTITDCHANETASVVGNSNRTIALDTITVLRALLALSSPEGLYCIPLVTVHAIWLPTGGKTSKTLQMGVYANRLLFEVMTTETLQVVMAACDTESYHVKVPLQQPVAVPEEPFFESAASPALVWDESSIHEVEYGNTEEEQENDWQKEGTRECDTLSAFSNAGLLRLWENHGCLIDSWPQIHEQLVRKQLQVELLPHQIHGVCWMLQQEEYNLNALLWEQREFRDGGTYWYSPVLGQVRLTLGNESVVRGGMLCDEMGLGKTVQMICLILASKVKEPTLIVVPPALVTQWLQEFQKIAGTSLTVESFQATSKHFEVSTDVVVTTYQALDHTQHRWAAKLLKQQRWGRVVLDEMQEIRSSTTAIAKNCEGLLSERRWMLSGTPIFEGIRDLRGELCFLRLEPFCSNLDDGFFEFAIGSRFEAKHKFALDTLHLFRLFLLRRSKSMTIRESGLPLLGLKPLTVTFEPVPQAPSERALYCFFEYLVHAEFRDDENGSESKNGLFLRLLRQLCFSVTTLSGGMGCTSQLKTLNELMKEHNRRLHLAERPEVSLGNDQVYSCDEAIRFLSHVTDKARVGDDFVTSLQMGGGGGVVRRQRAYESSEERLEVATERLVQAEDSIRIARSTRAKANWHLLLEKLTTGYGSLDTVPNSRIARLWKWRHIFVQREIDPKAPAHCQEVQNRIADRLHLFPILFTRGWRPTKTSNRTLSLKRLFDGNPKFLWAHPFSVIVSGLPSVVSPVNLRDSIIDCLSTCEQNGLQVYPIPRTDTTSSHWKAFVHFTNERHFSSFRARVKRSLGVPLSSAGVVPNVEKAIENAKTRLEEAQAEYSVYQCPENKTKALQARKVYERAQRGLCIHDESSSAEEGQVRCSLAFGLVRDTTPKFAHILIGSNKDFIGQAARTIANSSKVQENEAKVIQRLSERIASGISNEVQVSSAFEDLQTLKEGEADKTHCPLCHGPLGDGYSSEGKVAMTRCGHLFCRLCWKEYADRKSAEGRMRPPCMTCRKEVDQIVVVDPDRTADQEAFEQKRSDARALVQEAATMLTESNGQLAPHLWEALYLAFDLPPNVDRSGHGSFTAIPGDILAHIRHATGYSLNGPAERDGQLSTKIRALLEDLARLPSDELSVVFASSKVAVKHLGKVLEHRHIGYRALFTGQKEEECKAAVHEWQNDDKLPVLIVQAGAAACGLTLTAASKLFLLEPFLKHEEEQQAYGRLHRYGQFHQVECKVYYTPVSVESRLLEWRKQGGASETDKSIVYAPLRSDEETKDTCDIDLTQTRFLLGLEGYSSEGQSAEDDESLAVYG